MTPDADSSHSRFSWPCPGKMNKTEAAVCCLVRLVESFVFLYFFLSSSFLK